MLNRRVYLAGPIFGKTDAECMSWRNEAAEWLRLHGFKPVDPMRRDYRAREDTHAAVIVASDEEDIETCGYVLANANAPSWGTAMELQYAQAADCTVIAFATHANAPRISPWLRCHTDAIYESLSHALAGLVHGSQEGKR